MWELYSGWEREKKGLLQCKLFTANLMDVILLSIQIKQSWKYCHYLQEYENQTSGLTWDNVYKMQNVSKVSISMQKTSTTTNFYTIFLIRLLKHPTYRVMILKRNNTKNRKRFKNDQRFSSRACICHENIFINWCFLLVGCFNVRVLITPV